jgi:hypothetical protein
LLLDVFENIENKFKEFINRTDILVAMSTRYSQPHSLASQTGHTHIIENARAEDSSSESNVDRRSELDMINSETVEESPTVPVSETCPRDSNSTQAGTVSSEAVNPSPDTATSEDERYTEGLQPTQRLDSLNLGEQGEPSVQGRLPLRESLGLTGSATIFGGSTLILATLGFLSFLWFAYGNEPEGASAPWIWRKIAVNDWTTRSGK